MRYASLPLFAAFLLSLNALGVEFVVRRPVDAAAVYMLSDHSGFYQTMGVILLVVLVFSVLVVMRKKGLDGESKILRRAVSEDYEDGLP